MEDNTHSPTHNSQDWDSDWEVLASENPNPNPNLEVEEFDSSSSFPCGDVIRSNYFSIDSDSHQNPNPPNPNLVIRTEIERATKEEDSEIDPQFGTGSWMDPTQLPRTRVAKRRRNSSSSESESSVLSAEVEIGSEIEPPSNSLSLPGEFDPQENPTDKENEGVEMNMVAAKEEEEDNNKSSEKETVGWWRVPLEVLKYCVLRVSPVWSLSMAAAALMGFVLYRRRWLSRMKRKTQGIQLNVTVDDKKVSQLMSRAARLNEAFSVVKRVPIIRPSLPAPGFAQWPVVSLR